jgi:hypothetical protein
MIQVVNKKTHQGDGIYIGRPSPLGNPFTHKPGTTAQIVVASRAEAVDRYRDWLREQWRTGGPAKDELIRLAHIYRDTGQLTLMCWCHPLRCHGDVLADVIPQVAAKL